MGGAHAAPIPCAAAIQCAAPGLRPARAPSCTLSGEHDGACMHCDGDSVCVGRGHPPLPTRRAVVRVGYGSPSDRLMLDVGPRGPRHLDREEVHALVWQGLGVLKQPTPKARAQPKANSLWRHMELIGRAAPIGYGCLFGRAILPLMATPSGADGKALKGRPVEERTRAPPRPPDDETAAHTEPTPDASCKRCYARPEH